MRLEVLAAAVLALLAVGCDPNSPTASTIPRERALERAQRSATRHGYNLDKYTLSEFGEELSKDEREWVFAYECKPVPALGCHFLVVVDRSTGATRVIPGE